MSSERNKHGVTFADRALLVSLVLLTAYCFVFTKKAMPQGSEVKIEVSGTLLYTLPLSHDRTVTVQGPMGATIVEIHAGKVRVKASPCHNRICVHQGWIDSGAVVCLPNRVLVTITTPGRQGEFDGITG